MKRSFVPGIAPGIIISVLLLAALPPLARCAGAGESEQAGAGEGEQAGAGESERYEYLEYKMAVPVRLILYAPSKEDADQAAEAVYQRFDALNEVMSDWSPESEIIRACRAARTGERVPISDDLYRVLALARRYTELTQGAFDVSVSPVVKLWRRSRRMGTLPPEPNLTQAKALVGQQNWSLDSPDNPDNPDSPDSPGAALSLAAEGVRLDLGGIGKGFAIDEAFEILRARGLYSVLIDAGGDIRLGNPPPGKEGWVVTLASLDKETPLETRVVHDLAIATSGDTFQFVEIEGVRYSHIIDPRRGEPLTQRRVVSVLAPTAAEADALASGFTVLGPDGTAALARRVKSPAKEEPATEAPSGVGVLDGVEAVIVTEEGVTRLSFASRPEP